MTEAKRKAMEQFAEKIGKTIQEAVRRAFATTEARLAALEKQCEELEKKL